MISEHITQIQFHLMGPWTTIRRKSLTIAITRKCNKQAFISGAQVTPITQTSAFQSGKQQFVKDNDSNPSNCMKIELRVEEPGLKEKKKTSSPDQLCYLFTTCTDDSAYMRDRTYRCAFPRIIQETGSSSAFGLTSKRACQSTTAGNQRPITGLHVDLPSATSSSIAPLTWEKHHCTSPFPPPVPAPSTSQVQTRSPPTNSTSHALVWCCQKLLSQARECPAMYNTGRINLGVRAMHFKEGGHFDLP